MAKREQDLGDLRGHFGEQIRFLANSIKLYDEGQHSEAKRLATTLRVLLHDTGGHGGTSHALLVQLGWRDEWTWTDTAGVMDERGLLPISNLAPLHFSGERMEYRPKLGQWNAVPGRTFPRQPGYFVDFAEWWTMPVIRDADREKFSRRDLVLSVANTDGGAHVDPSLKEAYYRLSRSETFGWVLRDAAGKTIPEAGISPVYPSIRQVAEEVWYTVRRFWQPPGGPA